MRLSISTKVSEAEHIILYFESIQVLSNNAQLAANAGLSQEDLCKTIIDLCKNINEFVVLAKCKRNELTQAYEIVKQQDCSGTVSVC